jgi:diacylglycerol kinase
MTKLIKSFGWAINGLRTVWLEEASFRIEVIIGILAVAIGIYRNISSWQWIFLTLIIAFVLMGEIVNTAIEDICDKIQPNQDPLIGKIKDTMAAYVLVSSIAAAVAGILLFI